jgi:hypothetical protein
MLESVINVNPISSACLFVEMLYNGHKLACGTAFYYCHEDSRYLISNWHNYSGREPFTLKCKDIQAALPNQLKVHGRDQDNLAESKPIVLDLVDSNGSFLWLHHPEHKGNIDIGVLPVSNELGIDDIDITTAIHEIDPHKNWPTEVGEQLFVIGFPFGLSDTCNLPIWKAATLASEPEIDQEGLPLLYRTHLGSMRSLRTLVF